MSTSPIPPSFSGTTFVASQNGVQTGSTPVAQSQSASHQEIDATEHVNNNSSSATTAASNPLPVPTTSAASTGAACQTLNTLTPAEVGTDMYAIMALFQKMAQEQRNSARQVRETEMQAQVQTLYQAADEIRSAAQDRLTAAWISGSAQIVGGLVQMGAGAYSMKQAGNALSASTGQDALLAKGQAATTMAQGLSGMMTGGAGIWSAHKELDASTHEARKAELEAVAKTHDNATQQANEMMQQMMDVIRDVRDKLAAIDQSRLETSRGIARNI